MNSNIIPVTASLVFMALYIDLLLRHRRDKELLVNLLQERRSWLLVGEGGIYKRIDELREDVEAITGSSPEFFSKFPWVYAHFKSCDSFLNEIASLSRVMPEDCYIKAEPRNFPPEPEVKNGSNAFWETDLGKAKLAEIMRAGRA